MKELLGGRYDLQEVVGDGGMAVVYRAIDTMLERQVAVKMLRPEFASDEEFVSRFRREAQSAASLSHPNIINLYDVGVTHKNEYYIVMEYVDGPTLKELIRDRGPLPVPEAVDITMQICDALEHAHARHIVHQDIKPHNILLTRSGRVKVTDFGIARAITGNTITHHPAQSVLGSVHYFSPEQARGATTDAKTDIYSLGIVMYEMLTQRLPFSADSAVSVALKHLNDDFIDPREFNSKIPQSVENIIFRCLNKDPEDRYPDMSSLQADLKDALIHPDVPKYKRPVVSLDETISIPVVGGLRMPESENSGGDQKKQKRKWWLPVIYTLTTIVVLGVGVLAAYYIVMDSIRTPNLTVPNVTGDSFAVAKQKLSQAGFTDVQEKKEVNPKPKGVVYDQSPEGPSQVKAGRGVTLWVSEGPQQTQMPDLVNQPIQQAITTLSNLGIDTTSQVTQDPVKNTGTEAGTVISTSPQAGTPLTPTTQIVIQVSEGQTTTVPNVIGLSLSDAVKALKAANLVEGQVTYEQYSLPDNEVFLIAPYHEGDKVPEGTAIGLFVAKNSGESGGGIGNYSNGTAGNSGVGGTQPGTNATGQTGTGGAGGANGSNNSSSGASSQNTTSQGQGSSNAQPVNKTIEVKVNDTNKAPIQVQIYTADANHARALAVNQTIHATASWAITVAVTPDTPGQVLVYENGKLVQEYPVPYQ